jgi:hypothetical protein
MPAGHGSLTKTTEVMATFPLLLQESELVRIAMRSGSISAPIRAGTPSVTSATVANVGIRTTYGPEASTIT